MEVTEYKLYNGKELASVNGDIGLKGVLEELKNNEKFRLGLIHKQKFATAIAIGTDQLLEKEYMTREGTKAEFEREDKDTIALINFAKVLRENFPKDWKNTIVTLYEGALPLPKDRRCPSCNWKLQERKSVDGYTCRNKKCERGYHPVTSYGPRGFVFRPEESIGMITLEPNLDHQVSLEK
jgi:hypothetical protein